MRTLGIMVCVISHASHRVGWWHRLALGLTICIYSAVFCESPINPRRFIGTLSDIVTPPFVRVCAPHTRHGLQYTSGSSLARQEAEMSQ